MEAGSQGGRGCTCWSEALLLRGRCWLLLTLCAAKDPVAVLSKTPTVLQVRPAPCPETSHTWLDWLPVAIARLVEGQARLLQPQGPESQLPMVPMLPMLPAVLLPPLQDMGTESSIEDSAEYGELSTKD